jgi:hypothetical protein
MFQLWPLGLRVNDMPPIRKPQRITRLQAAHWLLGRLGSIHHTLESIQESRCSEALNNVFTTTEMRMLTELLDQAKHRIRLEITGN